MGLLYRKNNEKKIIGSREWDEMITKKTVIVSNGQKKLYGLLFLPDPEEKDKKTAGKQGNPEAGPEGTAEMGLPLVIGCHGFDGSYASKLDYAVFLAEHGIAFYGFDFYGGSNSSMSGGTMEEMSVLTEAEDLLAVIRYFRRDSRINPDRIILWGHSQGGYVASYVAGTHPDWIRALILLYPAYVIQDHARKIREELHGFPASYRQWDCLLGRIYGEDALSHDIYQILEAYPGQVLIVHGDQDDMVPIHYSERALKHFPHARWHVMGGAGHGFEGKDRETMKELALSFLEEVLP